jgi:hypothetical protein
MVRATVPMSSGRMVQNSAPAKTNSVQAASPTIVRAWPARLVARAVVPVLTTEVLGIVAGHHPTSGDYRSLMGVPAGTTAASPWIASCPSSPWS